MSASTLPLFLFPSFCWMRMCALCESANVFGSDNALTMAQLKQHTKGKKKQADFMHIIRYLPTYRTKKLLVQI